MGATDQKLSIVVCDAGPIIHLDELSALDLLSESVEVGVNSVFFRSVL